MWGPHLPCERKAEHFLAFVCIAASPLGYRRLTNLNDLSEDDRQRPRICPALTRRQSAIRPALFPAVPAAGWSPA
ncbi:hypothetical protein GCM10010104_26600 [Streptomyces indiaensis]|uniref:Uncharacterized protein n=1 Tax=Streptomyces indiaensis TaxID=284033 RepID=A0ABN3DHI1_9ACTN